MEFNFSSKPNRRFLVRLAISTTVVGLSVVAAKHLIGQGLVGGPLVWVLALIPGLAMVGIFYAYGMLIIEQKDEFIRLLGALIAVYYSRIDDRESAIITAVASLISGVIARVFDNKASRNLELAVLTYNQNLAK